MRQTFHTGDNMAEAYETNQVSFPPMTPFGVAYQEYIRKGQDPAAGVAQAKQNEFDSGRGSKNIVRGKIIRTEWSDPEQMTVTEPEIPIRKATSEENKQLAEGVGEPLQEYGAKAVLAGGALLAHPFTRPAAPVVQKIGSSMGAAGTLIRLKGPEWADKYGRLVVDYEKIPKRNQQPEDIYKNSSQEDPANMVY